MTSTGQDHLSHVQESDFNFDIHIQDGETMTSTDQVETSKSRKKTMTSTVQAN